MGRPWSTRPVNSGVEARGDRQSGCMSWPSSSGRSRWQHTTRKEAVAMPLTWDVTDVKDHDEVTTLVVVEDGVEKRLWHPVTETLVWMSMSTGIGRITEANAAEVYARI